MKTKRNAGMAGVVARVTNHKNPVGATHRTVSTARSESKRLKVLESRVDALEAALRKYNG